MNPILFKLFLLVISLILCTSCSRLSLMIFLKPPAKFKTEKIPPAPNYADNKLWHKWRMRDDNKTADVFYIHPTTYITGKGWNQDLPSVRNEKDFPEALKNYISYLEKELETPISIVSVGPKRSETIIR